MTLNRHGISVCNNTNALKKNKCSCRIYYNAITKANEFMHFTYFWCFFWGGGGLLKYF